jgi:hypothetical protein
METVILRAEDFRTIHNALCELRSIGDHCSDRIAAQINPIIQRFEAGLRDAYEQDEDAFDRKMAYYNRFKADNKLEAIWSMYEIGEHGFLRDHPYPSDASVYYQGEIVPVFGFTWGDVYRAADWAIRNSGDAHHIFIEAFESRNGNELHLVTGS